MPLSDLPGGRFDIGAFSGRIFISFGKPVTSAEPPRSGTRYDKVELTNPGVANLTAVDFFGIPFRLQTLNAAGRPRSSLGYQCDANSVRQQLLKIPGARRAQVRAGGQFVRILSPQLSPGSYPSFAHYLRSMQGKHIVLRGKFFGTPFETFDYSGRVGRNGTVRLTGAVVTASGPGGSGAHRPGQPIMVTGASLRQAIYTGDGPYTWGGAVHRVSDNDVYAAIYRDLIAGYAWGYFGGRYGNDSARYTGKPPFEAARKAQTRYAAFNPYAAVIYKNSNSYGFSFSDTGPKKVQMGLNGVSTLRITIPKDKAASQPRRCRA